MTNTAEVAPPNGITDTVEGNNTSSDPAKVGPPADLAITKTHDGEFTVGTEGTFTIGVANLGFTEDPRPLTVVDELPEGLELVSGGGHGSAT